MNSEAALSAFLYFVTIATSLGAAGSTAEICDDLFGGCPDRIKAFMATGFLTAFIAIPLLVASAFDISIIRRFEVIVSPFVVIFAIVSCAVVTSSETVAAVTIQALLAWYSLIPASGAMFLAFKNMGQVLRPKEKLGSTTAASVPLTGTATHPIPVQFVQQTYPAPAQPMTVGTPYSAPSSSVVNVAS